VLAAGSWTGAFARRLGVPLPVRPVRGQMLAFADSAPTLRHIVWGEAAYLVPKANGFLFVGATVEDVGFRSATTVRAAGLAGRVALCPAWPRRGRFFLGGAPGSADGLPILGTVPAGGPERGGHYRNGIPCRLTAG
jgi:glycine oxidase